MIEATEFSALAGIRHGFFTREGGHSGGPYASLNCGFGSGDDKEIVARNRGAVADRLGVAEGNLLTVWQWHSADVIEARAPWDVRKPPEGDAMVTATPGLAIGVLTADCAPVLFADAEARVIGAAHAGWKGALGGITDATIAAMEKLGARRERMVAVVGPTIAQASYEVGPELHKAFVAQAADNANYFATSASRPRHFMFDLPGYLAARLAAGGVGRCANLDRDTYGDETRFFSYRRMTHRGETVYGRQISAIALRH